MVRKFRNFMKHNKWKKLTIYAWFVTAYYRICILLVSPKKLQKYWGNSGKESSQNMSRQAYIYARQAAWIVDYVATRTPWESKCLVRALTARHLLNRHKVSSTLYLGVGKDEEGKMTAHAWLRCGSFYVSGGAGAGYATVARFSNEESA